MAAETSTVESTTMLPASIVNLRIGKSPPNLRADHRGAAAQRNPAGDGRLGRQGPQLDGGSIRSVVEGQLKPGQEQAQGLSERQRRQIHFGPQIMRDLFEALHLQAGLAGQTLDQIARRRQLGPTQRLRPPQSAADRGRQALVLLLFERGHGAEHGGGRGRPQVNHGTDLPDAQFQLIGQPLEQFAQRRVRHGQIDGLIGIHAPVEEDRYVLAARQVG